MGSGLDALLKNLTKLAALLEISDKIRTKDRASWAVPVAGIVCAGWMFTVARDVALGPANMAPIIYEVEIPAVAAGLDWFTDWSLATGDTSTAIRGTASTGSGLSEGFGGLTSEACVTDCLRVVAAPTPAVGADWPASMTNVLEIRASNTFSGSKMLLIEQGWPQLAVGEALFIRLYWMFEGARIPDLHWLHYGSASTGFYNFWTVTTGGTAGGAVLPADSTLSTKFGPSATASGRGHALFSDNTSTEVRAYHLRREEVRVIRETADSGRVYMRLFDADDSELSTAAIRCSTGDCQDVFGMFQAATDTLGAFRFAFSDTTPGTLRSLELGNNGSDANDPVTPVSVFVGGIAVRVTADTSAWIGTYPVAGTGEGN